MKSRLLLAALLLAGTPVLAADDATVVARVGTATITLGELRTRADADPAIEQLREAGQPEQARRRLQAHLDLMVEERILLAECDRAGIETAAGERPALRIQRLFEKEVDTATIAVLASEVSAYYAAHAAEIELPRRSVLYVFETRDRKQADDMRSRLLKDRDAWETLAEKEGLERREIADGALATELGPQGPVVLKVKPRSATTILTSSGYATVAVVERKPARMPALAEVAGSIREKLREDAVRARIAAYVKRVLDATPHWAKLPDD